MSKTRMMAIYGRKSVWAMPRRLEERRNMARVQRQERTRKSDKPEDFVVYEDSDSDDESPVVKNDILSTSYNFVDYIRSREMMLKGVRTVNENYGSRHILTHEMFKETPINLGKNVNKVFSSQWLNDRQITFGTKCNKVT